MKEEERKNNEEYKEFIEWLERVYRLFMLIYKVKSPIYGWVIMEI